MNKGELMKLVLTPEELKQTDSAIPYEWSKKLTSLGIEDQWRFVFCYYNAGAFGKIIDLTERFYKMYNIALAMNKDIKETL